MNMFSHAHCKSPPLTGLTNSLKVIIKHTIKDLPIVSTGKMDISGKFFQAFEMSIHMIHIYNIKCISIHNSLCYKQH